jgi:hypothetical protein
MNGNRANNGGTCRALSSFTLAKIKDKVRRLLEGRAMSIARLLLTLAASSLFVPTAFAQSATGSDTIVVTAQDRKELQHRITTFVRSATVVPELGQYARRNDAYCPKIVGLAPAYVSRVLDRVRAAGRAANLADPAPQCQPNLTIIFTDDGDAQMTLLKKRSHRLFTGSYREKERELFSSGRPIRWWYASDMSAASGGDTGSDLPGGASVEGGNGGSGALAGFDGARTVKGYTTSLIETDIKVDLVGTFVVVDVTKASGFALDSVASFAAMVSFAQINGKQDFAGFPSVLSLFASDTDKASAPTDLTEWDKAYLHALYTTPPNREAWIQRTRLAGKMMERIKP